MKEMKKIFICVLLTILLAACAPQATAVNSTPTIVPPTITPIPAISTPIPTALPTDTPLPTNTASPTPPSCAVALNPTHNATIPPKGAFDFTWTSFAGAASYVISIGPADWYPTNFPVTGTTLTRYMEIFPKSPSYQWSIAALDSSGQEVCKTGPYKFVTSVDQYATPSFANNNGGVVETSTNLDGGSTTNSQTDNSNSIPADYAKILSITDEPDCYIKVTVEVRHKRQMDLEVVQIRSDTTDGSLKGGFNLSPVSADDYPKPSIYQGESYYDQLSNYKNGQVLYFSAFFWDNTPGQGLIYDTFYAGNLIPHTVTTCSN